MASIKMVTLLGGEVGPDEFDAFIRRIETAEGRKFVRERVDGRDCLRLDISRRGVGNIMSLICMSPATALQNLDR